MIRPLVGWSLAMTLGAFALLACGDSKPGPKAPNGGGGGTVAAGSGVAGQGGRAGGGGGTGLGGAGDGLGGAGLGGAGGQGGRVATWDINACHVSPVPPPSDPAALADWSAARGYCEALGKRGCFAIGLVPVSTECSADEMIEACVGQMLWNHSASVPTACEDAWLKDLACATAFSSAFSSFCDEAHIFGYPYAPAAECGSENSAVVACFAHDTSVEVKGTYTTCTYEAGSGADCRVNCDLGANSVAVMCTGPAGLPQQCACNINGHILVSEYNPMFVRDCADAAQQAANGLCTSILDCCITYVDAGQQVCACRYPKPFGYESCQAMATAGHGTIVDICPQYLLDRGGCWPPNACQGVIGPPLN